MTWLILGLFLWWAAHVFKRVAPAQRAALTEKMGEASRGPFALVLLVSVVLMVIGYRATEFVYVYDLGAWARGLNNLLMIPAIALFGLSSSKSRLRGKVQNPMLMGFLVWVGAHLLVNGDQASIILFGGLGLWALVQMMLITRAGVRETPFDRGSVVGDLRLLIIALVLYGIIAGVHTWLGYNPFTM